MQCGVAVWIEDTTTDKVSEGDSTIGGYVGTGPRIRLYRAYLLTDADHVRPRVASFIMFLLASVHGYCRRRGDSAERTRGRIEGGWHVHHVNADSGR